MKLNLDSNLVIAYRAEVIRAGAVVETVNGKNLIVDGGLNEMGKQNRSLTGDQSSGLIGTIRFGSSTSPVKRGSGAVTFTTTGSGTVTVTASAGFFVASDVGRILKLDTGEEIRVTVYTSGTVVTGTSTGAVTQGQAGSIHYVNDTGLGTPIAGTVPNATSIPSGIATFNISTGAVVRNLTADSGTVTGSATVTEMGWFSPGSVMVGRVLLPGVGLGVVAGDIVRVTLVLTCTVALASVAAGSAEFAGTTRCYGCATSNASAAANGLSWPNGTRFYSSAQDQSVIHSSDFSGIGSIVGFGNFSANGNPAVGVFDYKSTNTVSEANGTIASVVWGNFWTHNLTTPFVKNSTMTMTINYRTTFTRTLTN